MRINVTLTTDGACSGNPGPGGYASILTCNGHERIVQGNDPATTNNKMELRAVIEGIRVLKKPCCVTVETDSKYVITGLSKGSEWAKNGWKLKSGAAPKNIEMWKELQALCAEGNHTIRYQYIEGHSGNPNNERCDTLAKAQIQLLRNNEKEEKENEIDNVLRNILNNQKPWAQQAWQGSNDPMLRAVIH